MTAEGQRSRSRSKSIIAICGQRLLDRNTWSAVPDTLIQEQFRNSNRVEIVHQLPLHLGVRMGVPYTQTSRSPRVPRVGIQKRKSADVIEALVAYSV